MKHAEMIPSIISVLAVFVFLGFTIYWCFLRKELCEKRMENRIQEEAIKGNKIAVAILKKKYGIIKMENEKLIYAALQGNDHAIEALDINERPIFERIK